MRTGGVVLLDDDEDLLEALSDLIRALGGPPCLTLRSVSELAQHRDVALRCDLAILDINLGPDQPSGLDAYGWLLAERFSGRVAFLTGHAQAHPLVERARKYERTHVLRKPLDVPQLRSLLAVSAEAACATS
jgi:FixJ family two-component response regulator